MESSRRADASTVRSARRRPNVDEFQNVQILGQRNDMPLTLLSSRTWFVSSSAARYKSLLGTRIVVCR